VVPTDGDAGFKGDEASEVDLDLRKERERESEREGSRI
jgi:hypothetical protein